MKRTEMVKVGDVICDIYQRDLDEKHPCLVDEFDEDVVGVPILSRRSDGKLAAIEGQHRIMAALKSRGRDFELECQVHYGLVLAKEARMFHKINKNRKGVSALASHNSQVVGEQVLNVEVDSILKELGMRLQRAKAFGSVSAIGSMLNIHKRNRNLRLTLAVAKEWQTVDVGATEGKMLKAISCFLKKYPSVDVQEFTKRLKRYSVLEVTSGIRGFTGSRVPFARAAEIYFQDVYNSGRRANTRLQEPTAAE